MNDVNFDLAVSIGTITRANIYDHDLPCISVKKAVEAGLLPEVHDYQRYDAEMWGLGGRGDWRLGGFLLTGEYPAIRVRKMALDIA